MITSALFHARVQFTIVVRFRHIVMQKSFVITNTCLDTLRRVILRDLDGCMITKIHTTNTLLNFRLSQVPVWTDNENAILTLAVQNNTSNTLPVYTSELQGDNVIIPYKDILIMMLEPGDSINVKMYVEHGTPKQHVMFRLVSACSVRDNTITIETMGTKSADDIIEEALAMI